MSLSSYPSASDMSLDSDPMVNTVVQLPMDYSTSLSFYTPYFYKTHIITFGDELDYTILSNLCMIFGCGYWKQLTGECVQRII